jgi:mRNA-degrading endonuclease toxin of MazEF toxin-antitoxin module
VLLISRDEAYGRLTWIVVAPLTTRIRSIPTAVQLTPSKHGVPQQSQVSLDNIQAIESSWLDTFITRLPIDTMRQVDRAIHFALGLTD